MARRRRRLLVPVALLLIAAAAGVGLWWLLREPPAEMDETGLDTAAPASSIRAAPPGSRRIRATLFYVSADGMRLVGVEREVPYGEGTVEQARLITEELLKPAPAGYASTVPRGTRLRGVFVSGRGEAFVDLSREVGAEHVGGSLTEVFTVYAIVNTLTTNLPAVSGVQILIEGREVDTLAGHIDLRHPLRKNLRWVQNPETP